MAEKGGTKILAIITICIMLISIGLSGCIGDDDEENEIYFILTYSTSSDIENNVTVIINTNEHEVYNETITPKYGNEIYREKASGNVYYLKAIWNNNVSETEFKPTGYKTLYLVIRKGNISFKIAQD